MAAFQAKAAPPDSVFTLMDRYFNDTNPKKTDLSVGAYRDNNGKPWVLPVVRKVDEKLASDPNVNHEYLPIVGNKVFIDVAAKLIFGQDFDTKRVASCQTMSGTGANHMAALLLSHFPAYGTTSNRIWIPIPTWGNHPEIFKHVGLEVHSYPYWDPKQRKLQFDNMVKVLENDTSKGNILLLHACAHNPTGMDPTREQWKMIAEIVKRKQLFVFFDTAYQGFASGNLESDAWAVRYFIEQNIDLAVCQSFSKNMGLYGERCGALHFVLNGATPESNAALVSHLCKQTRVEVSNPAAYGARIATKILTEPEYFEQWKVEVGSMAERITKMRSTLRSRLEKLNTPGTWHHITDQIGMFSYTGLTEKQSRRMVDDFHVYMLPNGRISMAGLNTNNVDYVADCINKVVTEDQGRL